MPGQVINGDNVHGLECSGSTLRSGIPRARKVGLECEYKTLMLEIVLQMMLCPSEANESAHCWTIRTLAENT